jgi:hypothetical protein
LPSYLDDLINLLKNVVAVSLESVARQQQQGNCLTRSSHMPPERVNARKVMHVDVCLHFVRSVRSVGVGR